MGARRQHRPVPVLQATDPQVILSSHPTAVTGLGTRFLDMLAAPGTDLFSGPDQQALQHLLAGFEPGATARPPRPPPREADLTRPASPTGWVVPPAPATSHPMRHPDLR